MSMLYHFEMQEKKHARSRYLYLETDILTLANILKQIRKRVWNITN